MSAALTYHVRAGQLSAVAAGRVFRLPTLNDPSRVVAWEKAQELRAGKHTLWDHCFEPPARSQRGPQSLSRTAPATTVIERVTLGTASGDAARLELYDWPGAYAQRFDGVNSAPRVHSHRGSAVLIGDRRTGIWIHGWPPCNLKRCVVVLRQWDDLVRAIASEAELSFSIVA